MNSFTPHITVATMVERDGRLLFVRERVGGKVVLNQPAGHVEKGESLAQAAFRETLEETAWRVQVESLVGVYVYQPSAGAGVYYRFCFVASPEGHDRGQKLDGDILEAVWLTPAEIDASAADHRSPLVARCVADYRAGRRLPLDCLYQHPWPLQKG